MHPVPIDLLYSEVLRGWGVARNISFLPLPRTLVAAVGCSRPVALPCWFPFVKERICHGTIIYLSFPSLSVPVSPPPFFSPRQTITSPPTSVPLVVPTLSAARRVKCGARFWCTARDISMTRRCSWPCDTHIALSCIVSIKLKWNKLPLCFPPQNLLNNENYYLK